MTLNPRTDFRDDGRTPAWRANQATWNRPPRGLRQRWRRLNAAQQLALLLELLAAPWVALAIFLEQTAG